MASLFVRSRTAFVRWSAKIHTPQVPGYLVRERGLVSAWRGAVRLSGLRVRRSSTAGELSTPSPAVPAKQRKRARIEPLSPAESRIWRAAVRLLRDDDFARESVLGSNTSLHDDTLNQLLRKFQAHSFGRLSRESLEKEALALPRAVPWGHLRSELQQSALTIGQTEASHECTEGMEGDAVRARADAAAQQFLPTVRDLFAAYSEEHHGSMLAAMRELSAISDLRLPHTWYPSARLRAPRRVVFHSGPTNSGKTHAALAALGAAATGVYCAPLRLLALEAYERMNIAGIYTSLLTGQERREIPGASHLACTVEMCSTSRSVEAAVIDEIQMIGDEQRGSAWTRAFLGVIADEVHVCGDPVVEEILQRLCDDAGDTLEVRRYERRAPLYVEPLALEDRGGWEALERGDCVVAFSRRALYRIRSEIERRTPLRCAMVYGMLPPETRVAQARAFNDEDGAADVLIATDAVGMGLNLNIGRIVFAELSKSNGTTREILTPTAARQIAGRAGRYGMRYPHGRVAALRTADAESLAAIMEEPAEPLRRAGLFPPIEQIEAFASHLGNDIPLHTVLAKYLSACVVDGGYFVCNFDHVHAIAKTLQRVEGLSLRERFIFATAPFKPDRFAMAQMMDYAACYADDYAVPLGIRTPTPRRNGAINTQYLEGLYNKTQLYLWLSQSLGEEWFPDRALAEDVRRAAVDLLNAALLTRSPAAVDEETPKVLHSSS